MTLLCPRCASRMVAALDRDAIECELCGHSESGQALEELRGWRRWWRMFVLSA